MADELKTKTDEQLLFLIDYYNGQIKEMNEKIYAANAILIERKGART